jgi:hypothetical protein
MRGLVLLPRKMARNVSFVLMASPFSWAEVSNARGVEGRIGK